MSDETQLTTFRAILCGVCGWAHSDQASILEHMKEKDEDGDTHDSEPWDYHNITVGDRCVWERDQPHARALLEVVGITTNGDGDVWVRTCLVGDTSEHPMYVLNELARFVEATRPKPSGACLECGAALTLTLAYPGQQSNAGVHDVWDLDDGQSSVCHSLPMGLTPRQALSAIMAKGSKESQTPTEPGWYWLARADGCPVWAPVEIYLSRSKSRPVLLVKLDDNNIRVLSSLNLPIWGPKLTPPPRIRRGDPRRPCEDCGATEGSTRDQRGFDRCNKCGYPSQ